MKLKEGDVFTIPVSESLTGFGQIVKDPKKDDLIIIVFKELAEKHDIPNIEDIVNGTPLLLGFTMDAKLYHGHWEIIGNHPINIGDIRMPYFKLGTPPGDSYITNYKGQRIRPITLEEYSKLGFKSFRSPAGFEKALKAYHKFGDWREDFDRLLYGETLKSIDVVEGK
jgi:hypothetical protein